MTQERFWGAPYWVLLGRLKVLRQTSRHMFSWLPTGQQRYWTLLTLVFRCFFEALDIQELWPIFRLNFWLSNDGNQKGNYICQTISKHQMSWFCFHQLPFLTTLQGESSSELEFQRFVIDFVGIESSTNSTLEAEKKQSLSKSFQTKWLWNLWLSATSTLTAGPSAFVLDFTSWRAQ